MPIANPVRIETEIPLRAVGSIAASASISAAIDLEGGLMCGVGIPESANWTDANLTFQVSADGGNSYYDLYKNNTEYTVTVATGRTNPTFYDVPPQDFAGYTHVKVRSGTAGTPVTQAATRPIQIARMP